MTLEQIGASVAPSLKVLAAATLAFGAWSLVQPGASVALYQAIMRFFNWRVEPIDWKRELLTTRLLGASLILLSLLSFWLLLRR